MENNGFLIPASNSAEAMSFCEMYSQSDFCPKSYKGKPQELYICCVFGARLGMDPISASQNIAVVNGKPSIYGDALKGLVIGYCDAFIEKFDEEKGIAICEIHRKGLQNPVIGTFSWADAQTAGLIERPVWRAYPKRMLQMRARGFAIRDAFPDKIAGLITQEEAGDYVSNYNVPPKSHEQFVSQPKQVTQPEQKGMEESDEEIEKMTSELLEEDTKEDVKEESAKISKTEKVLNMLGENNK